MPISYIPKSYGVNANRQKTYNIQVVDDLINKKFYILKNRLLKDQGINNRCLLVTTPTVSSLYAETLHKKLLKTGINCALLVLDCNEEKKSLEQVGLICEAAVNHDLGRDSYVIAFGGGICSDLVTMAASMYRRGIRTICIPTTLIGQVDASIGVKGAVNFQGKKSRLGCYQVPDTVLIDSKFLQTLPIPHLRNGFAEIIKIAIIKEGHLFKLCHSYAQTLIETQFQNDFEIGKEIIWLAVCSMLEELEQNLYEDKTSKRLVDFGHTFSPQIEEATNYDIPHGEAVSIDMAFSSAIAYKLGKLSKTDFLRIVELLENIGLPVNSRYLREDIWKVSLDETILHRRGMLNFVTPIEIGKSIFIEERGPFSSSLLNESYRLLVDSSKNVKISNN